MCFPLKTVHQLFELPTPKTGCLHRFLGTLGSLFLGLFIPSLKNGLILKLEKLYSPALLVNALMQQVNLKNNCQTSIINKECFLRGQTKYVQQ